MCIGTDIIVLTISTRYPNGHYAKKLGEAGKLETEVQAILIENEVSRRILLLMLHDLVPRNCKNKFELTPEIDRSPFSEGMLADLPPWPTAERPFVIPPEVLQFRCSPVNSCSVHFTFFLSTRLISQSTVFLSSRCRNWRSGETCARVTESSASIRWARRTSMTPSPRAFCRMDTLRSECVSCVRLRSAGVTNTSTCTFSTLRLIVLDIADVSHFVKHDSLLDIEARSRGTTVYLADRRLDMLPAVLSECMKTPYTHIYIALFIPPVLIVVCLTIVSAQSDC